MTEFAERIIEEKRQARRAYLLMCAQQAGFGDNVEAYIEHLKSMQPNLQPLLPEQERPVMTEEDAILTIGYALHGYRPRHTWQKKK